MSKTESDHFVFSKLALQVFVSKRIFFFLYIYERFQGTTPFKALFVTLFILISDNKKALLEDFLKAFFEQTTFLIFFFFFTFFYMY